jgi:RNA polymerase sigma-70 factor (ECF subfamily)
MLSNPLKGNSPPPSALSDGELVEGIKGGNKKLLNELYNRYATKIYYKCLSMVKDANLAQDMSHDVFIKVSTNLNKYKGTADLSFWIYAITYNHCISHLRKAKRIKFDAIDQQLDPEDHGEHELTEKIVRDLKLTQLKRLIKKLKPNEEVILLMRYQDGMSVKQIAAILQIKESAVKMRLKRCRNHLAELFNDLDHE